MQILVDVSLLMELNFKYTTGIQRVVKSILRCWINTKLDGVDIRPIYSKPDAVGFYYVDNFNERLNGCGYIHQNDTPVVTKQSDIYLGLDLNWHVIAQRNVFEEWHHQGVSIYFVVYDLIPILYPDCFDTIGYNIVQRKWIKFIAQYDGLFCISKSVMHDVKNYLNFNLFDYNKKINIDWFNLGSDICDSNLESNNLEHNNIDKNKINFLMVGTIEPRKSHQLVLDAFNVLWHNNIDCNLLIAGKIGWSSEDFIEKLVNHSHYNKNVFLESNANDALIRSLYLNSDCYIAASITEGFGLPIVEAAKHGLPIIARDIPIFREIGQNGCYYFKDESMLAQNIYDWIQLYNVNQHPNPSTINIINWNESASILMKKIMELNMS